MIIKVFRIIPIFLVIFLLLAACTSSPNAPEFQGSEETGAGEDGANPSESGNGGGEDPGNGSNGGSEPTSVDELISSLSIPGADSDAFQTPSSSNLSGFNLAASDFLTGSTTDSATLNSLGYSLLSLSEDGDTIAALTEDASNGGGTYIFNQSTDSSLIIEVPHPLFDTNTLNEGVFIFKALRAKALFIAGTHRCANSAGSSCSGTTSACGSEEAYRISDVAHAIENFFHEAHKAADDTVPFVKFIQLHGYDAGVDEPAAIVSNGSETDVGLFAYVNKLATSIDSALSDPDFAVSCNAAGDDGLNLCGTTNVQGRYTNGSANECTTDALGFNGRFTHLEQSSALRQDSTGWQLVSDAIDSVF